MIEYSLKLTIEQDIRVLLKISLHCLWSHWRFNLKRMVVLDKEYGF